MECLHYLAFFFNRVKKKVTWLFTAEQIKNFEVLNIPIVLWCYNKKNICPNLLKYVLSLEWVNKNLFKIILNNYAEAKGRIKKSLIHNRRKKNLIRVIISSITDAEKTRKKKDPSHIDCETLSNHSRIFLQNFEMQILAKKLHSRNKTTLRVIAINIHQCIQFLSLSVVYEHIYIFLISQGIIKYSSDGEPIKACFKQFTVVRR